MNSFRPIGRIQSQRIRAGNVVIMLAEAMKVARHRKLDIRSNPSQENRQEIRLIIGHYIPGEKPVSQTEAKLFPGKTGDEIVHENRFPLGVSGILFHFASAQYRASCYAAVAAPLDPSNDPLKAAAYTNSNDSISNKAKVRPLPLEAQSLASNNCSRRRVRPGDRSLGPGPLQRACTIQPCNQSTLDFLGRPGHPWANPPFHVGAPHKAHVKRERLLQFKKGGSLEISETLEAQLRI